MRSSVSPPETCLSNTFVIPSRNPTIITLLHAINSLQHKHTRKITILTDSSTLEDLNQSHPITTTHNQSHPITTNHDTSETFGLHNVQLLPFLPWDDSRPTKMAALETPINSPDVYNTRVARRLHGYAVPVGENITIHIFI